MLTFLCRGGADYLHAVSAILAALGLAFLDADCLGMDTFIYRALGFLGLFAAAIDGLCLYREYVQSRPLRL